MCEEDRKNLNEVMPDKTKEYPRPEESEKKEESKPENKQLDS